jgi:hypothetical protein
MQQRQAVEGQPIEMETGLATPGIRAEGCGGPERRLLEAARRAGRSPQGRMALALHLSRLAPPGPRPHHRRIARAILDDTALRHDGQVFALGNGDMVLLCALAPQGQAPAARPLHGLALSDPAAVSATLAALLRVDLPNPADVATVWPLPETLAAFTAYAAERVAESGLALIPPAPPGAGPAEQTVVVGAIAAIAEGPASSGFMHHQVGVLVPAADRSARQPLLPLYRELSFSIAALEARLAAGGQAAADPFLFRHLAFRLDRRMLALLADAAGTGGPLDIAASVRAAPPSHINLTLPAILSDDFARLAARCRRCGVAVGIEVALVDACGDAAAFARARGMLADAGLKLVLDSVSYLALLLAQPCALRPDLVKLDWSPVLPELQTEERLQLAAALERIGLDRVVLHHAETEAALRWGMAQGLRRFQGRHVDAILAAGRILACPQATGCTVRQCIERSAVVAPACAA